MCDYMKLYVVNPCSCLATLASCNTWSFHLHYILHVTCAIRHNRYVETSFFISWHRASCIGYTASNDGMNENKAFRWLYIMFLCVFISLSSSNCGYVTCNTPGCPKNTKRCWYSIGSPPPAGQFMIGWECWRNPSCPFEILRLLRMRRIVTR